MPWRSCQTLAVNHGCCVTGRHTHQQKWMSLRSVPVFAVNRYKSKREPSRQYLMYTPSSKSWTACENTQVKNRLNRAGAIPDFKRGCCVSVGQDIACQSFVKQFYHLQKLPEQPQSHTHTHTHTHSLSHTHTHTHTRTHTYICLL